MPRAIAAAFALMLVAVSAGAQGHLRSHAVTHPHDSLSHPPMDPALHALLHSTWTGNLVSARGAGEVRLSVFEDSLHGALAKFVGSPAGLSGNASTVAIRGDTLRWRQELADRTCPAMAVLSTSKSVVEQSLNGRLFCEGGDMTFVLHKTAANR